MEDYERIVAEAEKQPMNLYDMKDHPVVQNLLINNGLRAFNEFVKLIHGKDLDNQKLDESIFAQALDAVISDSEETFHVLLPVGMNLYRCRKIESSQKIVKGKISAEMTREKVFLSSGYNEAESKEPPLFKPSAQRANIAGISYLYLAEEPYTACAEIRPDNHSYVSVAKFSLLKEARIIDLRTNQRVSAFEDFEREHDLSIAALITAVMQFFGTPNIEDSIYPVTQYVADYIRKAGFDGVRYQSAMSGGSNITLFNCHRSRVKFVDSKIVLVHSQHLNIVDLENGKLIPSAVDESWKVEDLNNARGELIRIINRSYMQEDLKTENKM